MQKTSLSASRVQNNYHISGGGGEHGECTQHYLLVVGCSFTGVGGK